MRSYILDINSMIGTLYNTGILTEQKAILDFNGKMFKRIQQISAFVMDFETNEENNTFDIFTIFKYIFSHFFDCSWYCYFFQ